MSRELKLIQMLRLESAKIDGSDLVRESIAQFNNGYITASDMATKILSAGDRQSLLSEAINELANESLWFSVSSDEESCEISRGRLDDLLLKAAKAGKLLDI